MKTEESEARKKKKKKRGENYGSKVKISREWGEEGERWGLIIEMYMKSR